MSDGRSNTQGRKGFLSRKGGREYKASQQPRPEPPPSSPDDRRLRDAEAGKAAILDVLADAERIARWFHAAYETHAPSHGYETRTETAVPWDDLPDNNRSLMLATVREVVDLILTDAYDRRRK